MMLVWIIFVPLAGGMLAWATGRRSAAAARAVALAAMAIDLGLAATAWWGGAGTGGWFVDFQRPWLPQFGISVHLGLDGLSMVMVALTAFLGLAAVAASWRGIQQRVGFFHLHLLWAVAAIQTIFLARDLFLFYVAWEALLVPLYFLIAVWGGERRSYAAMKMFIFGQASAVLMLVAFIALAIMHQRATGEYTFDYGKLLGTPPAGAAGFWLMLAVFTAMAVKLPAVPVHVWLPDAHQQAPASGGVDIAALAVKVGAYGMLRLVVPLFPAAREFAPVAMALGVIGILYGASMAFSQRDLKRLAAYSSISHMGFILLGAFAFDTTAVQGAIIVMVAGALSAAGLFLMAGVLERRLGTMDIQPMGGLWAAMPRAGGCTLLFALAAMGLPGLANFAGEFLVLLGTYQMHPVFAALAALGMVASVIYAVRLVGAIFHGPRQDTRPVKDLSWREGAIAAALAAAIVWVGIHPGTILQLVERSAELIGLSYPWPMS
jgi:NADH-quinone oxidoreductase subunit M